MGEALFELEQVLRSSQYKLTLQEENVLSFCKGKALREFTLSTCIASAIAWTALRRLSYGFRGSLSGGAAVGFGLWRFDRSLSSCVDNILGMQGSRMQKELATILLTRHQHDPTRMRLINKHFYSERVFDDSGSDRPVLRWRLRNVFVSDQKPNETDSREDDTSTANLGTKQPLELRQFHMRVSAVELSADPFENVFGNAPKLPEEIVVPQTGTNTGTKKLTRKEKRIQRRHHRARLARASSDDDDDSST